MSTFVLTLEVAEEAADDTSALLLDAGAEGAEVRGGEVLAMPGARRPPPGRALVLAFFADRARAEGAAAELGLSGEVSEVQDEDWSETWKRGLEPFDIGRVHIRPSWAPPPAPGAAQRVEVVLDPGMAFGTGTHPTTALCLAALDRHLAAHPGAGVLDVGTGSGLLAIAAARLGAVRVAGTENDPVALRVAAENAARNGVSLELLLAPPDAVPGTFGLVVANILANTLVELAPGVAPKVAPGGALVLSGLLEGQEEEVRAAYQREGLLAAPELDGASGAWRLVGLRRAP